jgi:hypothetical protein
MSLEPSSATPTPPATQPPNLWLELGVTILAPALILMQLTERLGALPTLLLALALPLGWGLHGMWTRRKFGLMATLGVISTLLTGGISLLKLDAQWLAVKEAAVPGAIGLAVLISAWTRYPLIRALVFNETLFDVPKVQAALVAHHSVAAFDKRLRQATVMLAGTFFFSSVMNYFLARWIVDAPAGTPTFNEQLGRLTLLSYPVIALPSMVMMMALLWWLGTQCHKLVGLGLVDMMRQPPEAS